MRKWITALLGLLVLTGCGTPQLQRQTFTVELGQDIYANAALYLKDPERYKTDEMDVEALNSGVIKKENRFTSKNLDYLVVGEYDFTIHDGNKDLDFTIVVKDTQPPTINSYQEQITVPRGTIINWADYFDASDLSGVSFSTSSNFDTSTVQTTDVDVQVQDRFGNSVVRSVKVTVS